MCKERYETLAAHGATENHNLEVKLKELKAENMMLVSRPPPAPLPSVTFGTTTIISDGQSPPVGGGSNQAASASASPPPVGDEDKPDHDDDL